MKTTCSGQAGWRLQNDKVDLFITENGGQMAPVSFYADTASPIQPYYLSPWQEEHAAGLPDPVLVPLRGDFFCMPFGGNAEPAGREKHRCHGEPSSAKWQLKGRRRAKTTTTLILELKTQVRPGAITKNLHLVKGQNLVYTSHVLAGYSGKMPVGHHAILAVPDQEDAVRISVGKFDLGMTNPGFFANPATAEYQSFDLGRKFQDLAKVPMLQRNLTDDDCSRFPRRKGFEDLLQIFKRPGPNPAWSAVAFPDQGYLWFSLKDAAVLPGTVLWLSNRGRHSFPWNGRNLSLAVEDTCSYFANGIKDSLAANCITRAGFKTALALSPKSPTAINYIQGVVKLPRGFGGEVAEVVFGDDTVTFVASNGKKATTKVRHDFLRTGQL